MEGLEERWWPGIGQEGWWRGDVGLGTRPLGEVGRATTDVALRQRFNFSRPSLSLSLLLTKARTSER